MEKRSCAQQGDEIKQGCPRSGSGSASWLLGSIYIHTYGQADGTLIRTDGRTTESVEVASLPMILKVF